MVDWEAPIQAFDGVDLALLGTSWNYQDKPEEFLTKLETLQESGLKVCNSADVKKYRDSAQLMMIVFHHRPLPLFVLWALCIRA